MRSSSAWLVCLALVGCHWALPLGQPTGDVHPPDLRVADLSPPDVGGSDAGMALGPAVPLAGLGGSGTWETDPALTGDGLTIYFTSSLPSQYNDMCIFSATRESTEHDFGLPSPMLESSGSDFFAVNPDDTIGVYSSDRDGNLDMWIGGRAGTSEAWDITQFARIDELNTQAPEWDARLSADGLRLYYAPEGFQGAPGAQIVVAERSATDMPFGKPMLVLGPYASDKVDCDPAPSADEKLLVFTSTRGGGKGQTDLWYAVRPDIGSPFSSPRPLADLNTAAHERDPFLTSDGKWLYFTSTRDGNQSIYRAQVLAWP